MENNEEEEEYKEIDFTYFHEDQDENVQKLIALETNI